jgi:hypothetical protein
MKKNYNFRTRIAVAVACLTMGSSAFAQTTLISPTGDGGFENGGTFAANGWSVSNSVNNPWVIGVSGAGAPVSGNSAFISNDGGITNAYTPTNNTTNYFWRDITVPAGETKIILTYNWRSQGEASWDNIQVFYAPTTITPVGVNTHPGSGTTNVPAGIAGATNIGFSEMGGVATVNTATFQLPTALAGTTFRLIFSWKNETGGTQPPATIDNISLISQLPGNFISIVTGNWSAATTWDANAVPTFADNVTVSAGHVVTLNATGPVAANVLVDGTLAFGATPGNFTVNGNLTVSATGIFNVFNGTTGKTLLVAGNLVNNGTINLSVGTGATAILTLNGNTVQTVSGTGVFTGNVIRNLTFANTSTATPNINWLVNDIKIANNLNITGARINMASNKLTFGNGAAGGTLTAPAGTGFLSGKFSRFWTATATGSAITAGTDPTNATSRYPFINAAGENRAMYISRSSSTGTGNTAGELAVVYTNGTGMTTGLSVVDGAYTVTDRYNGSWTVTAEAGYVYTSGTHTAVLLAQNAYVTSGTNSRVITASALAGGTHQTGTTTPGAQRTGLSTAELTNASGLYIGANSADIFSACSGTPMAGTSASTANPVCSGVSFTLSVTGATTGVTGLTYQWQSSTDGTTFTNIGSATAATYVTTQTATTYYQLIVTCTNGGARDTSSVLMVTMNTPTNCYCVPTFTDAVEPITSVIVGSITNVTSPTVGGTPALENFTAMSTSMGQGTSNLITVKGNTDGNWSDSVVVFADWNQDGDFIDSGERSRIGVIVNSTGVDAISVSGNIIVPATATLGNTRMRVMKQYGTGVVNPCRTGSGYGQAEDYTVTVTLPPACSSPTALSANLITTTTASLGWNCTSCTGTFALEYGPTGFTPGSGTIVNPAVSPVAVSGLTANTAYQFYVVQDCGGGSFSAPAGPFTFTTKKLGDDVCDAIALTIGANGPFSNVGATVQTGEPIPANGGCMTQTTWCDGATTANNSLWFTFVAPASGRVSIAAATFDNQLALWSAPNCGAILTGGATLIAANDDAIAVSPYYSTLTPVNCLTPGATYYVQLDGYSGATGSTTLTLTDLGAANASFTGAASSYCLGAGAVTLTPATSGGTFSGTGVTGSTFNPTTAGVGTHTIKYKITACDSTMQTITVNGLPTVAGMSDDADNTVCAGTMVTLNGSGASTYTWAGATAVTNNVAFTPSATDTYTVTGTDANGCMNTSTVMVTVNALPTVTGMSDDADNSVCAGTMVTLTGGGAATYTWAGATTVMDGVAFTPSATDTYTVTGTDANGCMNTTTVSVTVNAIPTVTGMSDDADNSVCAGTMVTLTGAGAATYTWAGATTVMDGVAFTPSATDTYTVTGTDASGCMNTSTVTLTVNSLPVVTGMSDDADNTVCAGTMVTLTGGGASTYTWAGATTVMNGVAFTPSATDTYTVTGTDANGCMNTTTVSVTVNAIPTVTGMSDDADNTVCAGTMVTLTGGGAATYTWAGATTVMDGVAFTPSVSDTYTVTGTDANGCMNTSTVMVTIESVPTVTGMSDDADNTVCAGTMVTLTGGGAATYTWAGATTVMDGVAFTPSATDTYTVTGTTAGGCMNTATVTVTVNSLPAVSLTPFAVSVCDNGGPVSLGGGSPAGGVYSGTGVSGSTFDPSVSGAGVVLITYTVTDANACSNSDSAAITVDLCSGIAGNTSSSTEINVFPNPASEMISISITNADFSQISISITDLQGKEVFSATDKNVSAEYKRQIDVQEFGKGIYFIRMNTGNDSKVEKLIIQ